MHEARSYYSSRNRADWDCNRFSDFVGKVAEAHDLTLHRDALPKRIQLDPDFLTVIDKLRAQRLHDRSRKWSFIGSVHPAARASMWPNLEQSRDANVGLTPVIDVQVERTFFDLIGPSLFASGHRSADLYDFMRFSSRIGFLSVANRDILLVLKTREGVDSFASSNRVNYVNELALYTNEDDNGWLVRKPSDEIQFSPGVLERLGHQVSRQFRSRTRRVALLGIIGLVAYGGCNAISSRPSRVEVDRALNLAVIEYNVQKARGVNFSNGPCLTNNLMHGWVADIAHNPRQPVDNFPENQCAAYTRGRARHFIELDSNGNFIRQGGKFFFQ